MHDREVTQRSAQVKKYLIKRERLREQRLPSNSSIFHCTSDCQDVPDPEKDPFKKYHTMTTKADNASALHSFFEETSTVPLGDCRLNTLDALPQIVNRSKPTMDAVPASTNAQLATSALQLKHKEISRHVSDPYYLSLEKTISRRVQHRHGAYQREWLRSQSKRGNNSLLSTSLQKAAEQVRQINLDAHRRRNMPRLQEMLRDNIAQKTFAFPAAFRPEIGGLKGRGGRVVSLFEKVQVLDQVLKIHNGKM